MLFPGSSTLRPLEEEVTIKVATRLQPYKNPDTHGAETHIGEEIARWSSPELKRRDVVVCEAVVELVDRSHHASMSLDLARIQEITLSALPKYGCNDDDISVHVTERCRGREIVAYVGLN